MRGRMPKSGNEGKVAKRLLTICILHETIIDEQVHHNKFHVGYLVYLVLRKKPKQHSLLQERLT